VETSKAIATRRSTRQFARRPVSKEILERIAEAGRLAPTARNEQPWEFVIVTLPGTLEKLANLTDYGKFIAAASACIAVFCRDTKYYLEDGCAATENMLLTATDLGLQSCWVAGDKKSYVGVVAQLLDVPPQHNLVSLIALGYGDGPVKVTPKRELAKILHWEKFQAERAV